MVNLPGMVSPMSTDTPLQAALRRSLSRGRLLTSPAQLAGYDADGLGYKTFRPDAVIIPADVEELIRLVGQARHWGVPLCLRGAGTSLSGGPVAAQGGVILHTSALRAVREVNPAGYWCEVEAGVTLNYLDAVLKPYGLFYPPDPSSGPVCTLGGNVAMNAGGAHCFRYGVTSNYVLGVEVVLLDGTVHRFGGPAGGRGAWREDWKRLMVGSEGTLGAFTRFWLRLLPRPDKVWTFRATYSDLVTAERAIHTLVAHASFPVAIELMDPRCVAMVENSPMAVGLPQNSFMLLTEIDGPADLVDGRVAAVAAILTDAGSRDVVYSDDETQRQKLWKARKAAGGLMGQLSADFVVQDAVIPKRALAEVLKLVYDEADAAGLRAVNVFHAGDGNLHPNFLFDSRIPGQLERVEEIGKTLMQRVVDVGGTLSGEHGIGNDKAAYMPLVFGPRAMSLQLAVPAVFNRAHQLNPLKVFPERRFQTDSPGDAHPSHSRPKFAATTERLFAPFLDPIDGIVCVPATATPAEVRSQLVSERLRFPLVLEDTASLASQIGAAGFTPASSRFGPYCDNVVGMNWQLPDGTLVRLGERVVKTTTGYDLFRFLLGTGSRYGHPVDYVLRLRPDCGATRIHTLTGSPGPLQAAVADLLHNCWIHWFDSVDILASEKCWTLRIVVHSPPDECHLVDTFVSQWAGSRGLECRSVFGAAPADGLPDVVFKTTPDRVLDLARRVVSESTSSVASCATGVLFVHIALSDPLSQVQELVARHAEELEAVGGDWQSRHAIDHAPAPAERDWISRLVQEAELL